MGNEHSCWQMRPQLLCSTHRGGDARTGEYRRSQSQRNGHESFPAGHEHSELPVVRDSAPLQTRRHHLPNTAATTSVIRQTSTQPQWMITAPQPCRGPASRPRRHPPATSNSTDMGMRTARHTTAAATQHHGPVVLELEDWPRRAPLLLAAHDQGPGTDSSCFCAPVGSGVLRSGARGGELREGSSSRAGQRGIGQTGPVSPFQTYQHSPHLLLCVAGPRCWGVVARVASGHR